MNVLPSEFPIDEADVAPGRGYRRPLRVLLVEDNEDDATLVLRLLKRGGYEPGWERVQTAAALEDALRRGPWDLVLSDYNMPQFDALQALRTLREHSAHVPFIIISGSIGEETAVAAMRAGANDYVMKTNLPRLVPAVERELRDRAERQGRARTQRALLDLQDKFQVIFHENLDVVIVIDGRGTILHVNRAVTRTMGYEDRSLVGQPVSILWPRQQKAVANAILEDVRREGRAFYSGPLRRLNGTICPMDLQASNVPWGHEEAVIVTLRDVTERQRAEQRLADEKEQLAVTLRSMGDGVITTDVFGKVVLLNGTAERLTGWTQTEAKGHPLHEVLTLTCGEEEKLCEEFLDEVIRTGDTVTMSRQVQMRNRAGRQYALAVKATPIAAHAGMHTGVVTVFRDITVEQKLEEELQKASKLESVGLLAGGIAHDFNNILTAILGHLSMAQTTDAPSPQMLSAIEKACLYATGLTRQLLTFAKGNEPIRKLENLAELTEESVRFALHGSNLQCAFDIAADLWPVELDRGQINQVINNLAINAVQASPGGGLLRVEAQNVVVGQEMIATLPAGNYARLTIRDNGAGIAGENLARIFDPYFTTKASGSGLGLATSYSIVKKHGGLISVESELGVGTAFIIYLPAKAEMAPKSMMNQRTSAHSADVPGAGGRVLFMDDEAILRELVGAMLEYLGYEVVCASRGEEAIQLYHEAASAGKPFDAVIVDLTVPGGMGGYETVRHLRQVDPQVTAIVSSGYSNDPIMAEYREHGFGGVIAKPYQIAELSKVLQDVMQKSV